jgi:hypothetical protein
MVAKSTSRIGPAHFRHTVTSTAKTCFNKTATDACSAAVGLHREPRRAGWARASMGSTAREVARAFAVADSAWVPPRCGQPRGVRARRESAARHACLGFHTASHRTRVGARWTAPATAADAAPRLRARLATAPVVWLNHCYHGCIPCSPTVAARTAVSRCSTARQPNVLAVLAVAPDFLAHLEDRPATSAAQSRGMGGSRSWRASRLGIGTGSARASVHASFARQRGQLPS